MFDYRCRNCKTETEEFVSNTDVEVRCPGCDNTMEKFWKSGPPTLTSIIPSYPGCKAHKAGYVHSHGDRPATKVQSGFGGCGNPKS